MPASYFYLCVYVNVKYGECPWKPEVGIRSPGTRVTVRCVVSDVHVGIKLSSFGRAASAIYLQST